ncbi:MAG: type II secretion system protein [Candidatus Peribacteraceae bacterium]|nr:type II secretion system protein [Candidatus Peribacteraceae bacterium]MDD5741818.1 type II secretion system protein [Candidatus Peribacteraceae bacterium]
MKLRFSREGFTLIELLLVIGIIAILASIVIVAINPTKQMGDARNAQRRSDVNTILNAIYQYAIDNNGTMPGCLGEATPRGGPICVKGSACADVTDPAGCDLDSLTTSYIVDLPKDPSGATGNNTNYTVAITSGRVTVSAPNAEQSQTISVTR